MSPPLLNIVGPGRLGRTLARLWHDAGVVRVGGVAGRDAGRTRAACDFIGAGQACALSALPAAALWLIATPDDAIAATVAALVRADRLRAGDVVFHCSGALEAEVLRPARAAGAALASVHPLKAFADPSAAIRDFAGTFCATEGDDAALRELAPVFDAIGAQRFAIAGERKLLYHTAAVLACNHLVALLDGALRCMEGAGVTRSIAWPALEPLIAGTLANIGRRGTQGALTGPVARGDLGTIRREITAAGELDPDLGEAYRVLSLLALALVPTGQRLERAQIDPAAQASGEVPELTPRPEPGP